MKPLFDRKKKNQQEEIACGNTGTSVNLRIVSEVERKELGVHTYGYLLP